MTITANIARAPDRKRPKIVAARGIATSRRAAASGVCQGRPSLRSRRASSRARDRRARSWAAVGRSTMASLARCKSPPPVATKSTIASRRELSNMSSGVRRGIFASSARADSRSPAHARNRTRSGRWISGCWASQGSTWSALRILAMGPPSGCQRPVSAMPHALNASIAAAVSPRITRSWARFGRVMSTERAMAVCRPAASQSGMPAAVSARAPSGASHTT